MQVKDGWVTVGLKQVKDGWVTVGLKQEFLADGVTTDDCREAYHYSHEPNVSMVIALLVRLVLAVACLDC